MHTRATAHPFRWGDTPTSRKRNGLKIQRNSRWMFIPDGELFDLATDIVDYIDQQRVPSNEEPAPAYSTSTSTSEETTR